MQGCQKTKLRKYLSSTWHRVIIKESRKEEAIIWLDQHNIIAHCGGFNDDYFDTNLNTVQFVFYEADTSDISCAESFAEMFTLDNEVRTYEV